MNRNAAAEQGPVAIRRLKRSLNDTKQKTQVKEQEDADSDQPELLSDYGENDIVCGLGEVPLDIASADAGSEPAADLKPNLPPVT